MNSASGQPIQEMPDIPAASPSGLGISASSVVSDPEIGAGSPGSITPRPTVANAGGWGNFKVLHPQQFGEM